MFTLSQVGSLLIFLWCLSPNTGLSACLCHCTIPCISHSLTLLSTSQPGHFSQPGQMLRNIVKLGTSAATSSLTYLSLSGDLQIPELPTAKGLGKLLTPQEICLGAWVSPGRLCASQLCFCLSLSATVNVHSKDKISLVYSLLWLTRQVDWMISR